VDNFPALIGKWISEYVFDGKVSRNSELLCCNRCGCKCFAFRYDEFECGKLYEGYRREAYFKSRSKYEFWYTRAVNDSFAVDGKEILRRRQYLEKVLLEAAGGEPITSILDYGGDRGQIIPDVCEKKFSFDVSGVECVPGVSGIKVKDELGVYDCVMVCHVLEHVADPVAFLEEVGKCVRPGGFVLIALPCEAFSLRFMVKNLAIQSLYAKYLSFLQRVPIIEKVVDFLSTAFKVKFNVIPPLGFIKQSEHLTVFSEGAIQWMVTRAGFHLQGGVSVGLHSVFGNEFVCVGRKV
jgi:SAM-dependent methyltransferase